MRIVTIDIGHNYGEDDCHRSAFVEDTASRILNAAGFDGFTLTSGTGYWKGDSESQTSARVYLTSETTIEDATAALRTVAGEIRDTLQQDAVGFTVQDAEVEFV